MVVFENNEEIDIAAISTFGVSVKEGDNPIGFFGTGLKYAIAVLLRTGHAVTIFSGATVVDFGIRKAVVRGQEFDFITMAVGAGKPIDIGFTTELGKRWALWMAYREIACNCKDEGGTIRLATDAPSPKAGKTAIMVTGKEFESVFADRHRFILEDDPAIVVGGIEIRRRPGTGFYYRGVLVHNFASPGAFTYNETRKLDLTEDRTVKHQREPNHRVALAYLGCEDEGLLKTVLTANRDTFEGQLDFHGFSTKPSDMFLRTVCDLSLDRVTKINPSAVQVWKDASNKHISPRLAPLSGVQKQMLERALNFCSSIGFGVRDSYPIRIAESLGPGTLGMAMDETIFIAQRTFGMGTKYLAGTLIEEFLHLRHGYLDCSRDMQNFLFDRLMSMGEELAGEPL